MKRFMVATMVMAMILMASVATMAAGLDQEGQSGGYLVPNAQISNRLSVHTTYTDLNTATANQVGITVGALKHVEAGYTRYNNKVDAYHAKLGFSFGQKALNAAFAVGAIGRVVESNTSANSADAYLASEFTFKKLKNADLTLVARASDVTGPCKVTGEGSLGVEVIKGWSVYGEYVQTPKADTNKMAAFVQRDLGNAVLKAGVADTSKDKDRQLFLSASVSGI